jgi:4-hydroxy-tetrahydrodipicolinate reductase
MQSENNQKMKIAIIGYGKMGKMIESIAIEKGHSIGSCIDVDNQELLEPESLAQHDVAIEFTRPETAASNISKCLDAGVPVVSGTTGWTGNLATLKDRCIKENGSFLYASNFSLGVNILFHLNQKLASIMNHQEQYDVRIKEVHHTQKLDAPSGTALTLAEDILAEIERKNTWELGALPESDRIANAGKEDADGLNQATTDKLIIEALREGQVAGIHEVVYESEYDEISLRHSAKDRRGFAMGAVLAAGFIHDKKGFFTMKDILDL